MMIKCACVFAFKKTEKGRWNDLRVGLVTKVMNDFLLCDTVTRNLSAYKSVVAEFINRKVRNSKKKLSIVAFWRIQILTDIFLN